MDVTLRISQPSLGFRSIMLPKSAILSSGNGREPVSAAPRKLSQLLADFGVSSTRSSKSEAASLSLPVSEPPVASAPATPAREAGGATTWMPKRHVPDAARGDSHLSALFDRVEALLGTPTATDYYRAYTGDALCGHGIASTGMAMVAER